MSPLTTHILDTARGRPAADVAVVVELRQDDNTWIELARGRTNADGRIPDLLPEGKPLKAGVYRLTFATGEYHSAVGVTGFYPEVQVVVRIDEPAGHYHVPLLLSPFGYSTYRGS